MCICVRGKCMCLWVYMHMICSSVIGVMKTGTVTFHFDLVNVLVFMVQTGASSVHVKTLLGKNKVHFVYLVVSFFLFGLFFSLVSLKESEELKARLTLLHSN